MSFKSCVLSRIRVLIILIVLNSQDNAFWKRNEQRLFLHSIPALKLWTSSARCWIRRARPRQLKTPVIQAGWNLCQLIDAGPLGRTSEMARRSERTETETSCSCRSRSNARLILEFENSSFGVTGNEESIWQYHENGQSPSRWHVHEVLRCFCFLFFFSLFCAFGAKKLTHKQVRPRNVVVLICKSFIWTIIHRPGPECSVFFQNNVTLQYTFHIGT